MSLTSALDDDDRTPDRLDDRGLVPLDEARSILAANPAVTRDNLDQVWAALVSLADGAELAAAAAQLEWQMPPRGRDNIALVERYGAGALAWLRTRVGHGVLINHPWCVLPCVMALDDPGALELLLEVDGVIADGGTMVAWVFERPPVPDDHEALAAAALDQVLAWTRTHPDVAYPVLARRARTVPRAAAALRALALRSPSDVGARLAAAGAPELVAELDLATGLTAEAVLAELEDASARSWPTFHAGVDGRLEYFGQRLIGVRAPSGDGWAVVIERMQGSDPDMFMIARYAYGPYAEGGFAFDHRVDLPFELECDEEDAPVFRGAVAQGPAGELRIDESVFARHDLRPGWNTEYGSWSARTIAIRAYLAEHPDAYWPPVADALAAAGLPDGEVVVASQAYEHPSSPGPDGGEQPWHVAVSDAPAIRSLVLALVARDPARFAPGPSNLDWRVHALCESEFVDPWTEHRVDTAAGYLPAAMQEAAVEVDARGLMPLAEARALVATATSLARGDGRYVGARWVWDHDRAWAALLSLETADEAAAVFGRLDLAAGPRAAAENRALVERYGDGALALIAARARPDGVIAATSPLVRATVLAVASSAGFKFVWDLGGWDEPGATGTPDAQATALFGAWVGAHPEVGFVELGRLAAGGDAAAASFLQTWATPQARKVFRWLVAGLDEQRARALYAQIGLSAELVPAHVLACLDYWAAQAGDAWPRFVTGVGPSREYHALRLIGARVAGGDDWIVVLERLEGYAHYLKVQRYVYADDLPSGMQAGHARALADVASGLHQQVTPTDADAALIEAPDYWTRIDGAPAQVALARGLIAAAPARVWADPAEVVAALGRPAEVIVAMTAFAHTEGTPLPSQTACFRSLAEAIVARDPARFTPGDSNLAPLAHVATAGEG
ncbi:MAG: hypothetical protein IPL61_33920 [Myxococcales bacterium]|nr:hypothetical protein [Myxococcales bacterium]